MPSKSLYTHRTQTTDLGTTHGLSKFDKDLNFLVEYILTKSKTGWVCTCPARTAVCRHVRMIGIFENAEKGNDPLFNERKSPDNMYSMLLEYDGTMFDWIKGPESFLTREDAKEVAAKMKSESA